MNTKKDCKSEIRFAVFSISVKEVFKLQQVLQFLLLVLQLEQ